MGLSIRLLGPPRIERDGRPVEAPRGHKPWGLLAYLVRTHVPSSRERLAALLFPEADDPLGTLRWTLSALRRLLGEQAELTGDPVRLSLRPGTFVDVDVLARGSWVEALALPGLGHELLDGLVFRSSPGFENWLENERRHVAGTTAAVLREAALALLARGEAAAATDHASELVRLNPYDESSHVVLVRCLGASAGAEAAALHVAACTELFARELGVETSPALRMAAEVPAAARLPRVSGRAAVLAQIEAGEAAIAAGAVDTGLARLRGAVASARAGAEPEPLARALIGLGSALVHAARGTDEEGATALQEGSALAEAAGNGPLAATGIRELGWVQFLRARYDRAEASVARAEPLACGSDEELAWIDVIRGSCRSDVGDYAAAGKLLQAAVARSDRAASAHLTAFARTMLGRLHVLRGELEDGRHVLDETLTYVDARGLTGFQPWPQSFRAEIDLRAGDVDAAEERLERAFALGCEVGDPCWQSVAARGLGLVAAERGDAARALELLVEAPGLCRRLPDTYLWIEAYALDALCAFALEHGVEGSGRWIDELEAIAAGHGMRELLARATLYRAGLGEPGALEAARALSAQIENPALEELVRSAETAAAAA
ncbi:MAG TPA: BTAD domain-containing putative transcriptional regulator [Gaiellaceae bacterium]|nr:BTAD domain-containing putative transcriptional regulator [Gaiellaceae bacterium]